MRDRASLAAVRPGCRSSTPPRAPRARPAASSWAAALPARRSGTRPRRLDLFGDLLGPRVDHERRGRHGHVDAVRPADHQAGRGDDGRGRAVVEPGRADPPSPAANGVCPACRTSAWPVPAASAYSSRSLRRSHRRPDRARTVEPGPDRIPARITVPHARTQGAVKHRRVRRDEQVRGAKSRTEQRGQRLTEGVRVGRAGLTVRRGRSRVQARLDRLPGRHQSHDELVAGAVGAVAGLATPNAATLSSHCRTSSSELIPPARRPSAATAAPAHPNRAPPVGRRPAPVAGSAMRRRPAPADRQGARPAAGVPPARSPRPSRPGPRRARRRGHAPARSAHPPRRPSAATLCLGRGSAAARHGARHRPAAADPTARAAPLRGCRPRRARPRPAHTRRPAARDTR